MSPPRRELLDPGRQVGHRRRDELGLGADLRGVGRAERARVGRVDDALRGTGRSTAAPWRRRTSRRGRPTGGARRGPGGVGRFSPGRGESASSSRPFWAAWRKASSPSRSLRSTARRRFLASGTCWRRVGARRGRVRVVALAVDDERAQLAQPGRDEVDRRRRDDEQAEEPEQAEQHDRTGHGDRGGDRARGEEADDAARGAHAVGSVGRVGDAVGDVGEAAGGEGQRDRADDDAVGRAVVLRCAQQAEAEGEQHERARHTRRARRCRRRRRARPRRRPR